MVLTSISGLLTIILIPVLFLIHSLRHKSEKKQTTTLFIWEELLKEQRSRISAAVFLKNLSLLLQVLIVFLVTIALAEPLVFLKQESPGRHIILMDTSAGMKTMAGAKTRFEKAVSHALEIVENLPRDGRVMVIDAGRKPEIVTAFTTDKGILSDTIRNIEPKDVPGNMEKAIYLALSFLPPDESGRIHVITDGAGYDLAGLTRLNDRIEPVIIRGGEKNIGITLFDIRRWPGKKETYDILLEIKNYSSSPVICPLSVKTGPVSIAERNVGLDAGEKQTIILPYSGKIHDVITGEINVQDDLIIDNKVYAVLKDPPKRSVFLVSKGNYFLEKFLDVCPDIIVNTSREVIESSWGEIVSRNDIVILDNVAPPETGHGNFLLINTLSPDIPVRNTGTISRPVITDWNRKTPITAGITLAGIAIETAMRLDIQTDSDMVSILESGKTPLVTAFYNDTVRAVLVGFDISASDLPLRAAFPVLMTNIFQWLHPVSGDFSSVNIRAGEPFEISLSGDAGPVSIRRPSNKWEKYNQETERFVYEKTDEVGMYKIRKNREGFDFCVNLSNEAESDILAAGPDFMPDALKLNRDTMSQKEFARPVWAIFMILTALVFAAETILWIKKE